MSQADIGLIGLAVMGQNLVLNFSDHGYSVAVYNRTTSRVDDFLEGAAKGNNILGSKSVEELCQKLKRPRRHPFSFSKIGHERSNFLPRQRSEMLPFANL